jgi:hypothetical protein
MHFLLRGSKEPIEILLRDVEHVIYTGQGWWQLQSVCHIPQLSQDRKWTYVTWCQLAFDPKSLHTSRG